MLTISIDEATGAVEVNGPLDNPVLCYGLLEAAKDAIRTFNQQREKQRGGIVLPTMRVPPLNGSKG